MLCCLFKFLALFAEAAGSREEQTTDQIWFKNGS